MSPFPQKQKMLRRLLAAVILVSSGVLLSRGWQGGDTWVPFMETTLHASTASHGSHFAMATGVIDEDTEGVFVLDYQSGVLRCAVLNHQTGRFSASFETNVTKDLGASKDGMYQLVTGRVNFNRVSPAGTGRSIVYVLNPSNGEMAAYGIPWQREVSATGRPQVGALVAIDGIRVRR